MGECCWWYGNTLGYLKLIVEIATTYGCKSKYQIQYKNCMLGYYISHQEHRLKRTSRLWRPNGTHCNTGNFQSMGCIPRRRIELNSDRRYSTLLRFVQFTSSFLTGVIHPNMVFYIILSAFQDESFEKKSSDKSCLTYNFLLDGIGATFVWSPSFGGNFSLHHFLNKRCS